MYTESHFKSSQNLLGLSIIWNHLCLFTGNVIFCMINIFITFHFYFSLFMAYSSHITWLNFRGLCLLKGSMVEQQELGSESWTGVDLNHRSATYYYYLGLVPYLKMRISHGFLVGFWGRLRIWWAHQCKYSHISDGSRWPMNVCSFLPEWMVPKYSRAKNVPRSFANFSIG